MFIIHLAAAEDKEDRSLEERDLFATLVVSCCGRVTRYGSETLRECCYAYADQVATVCRKCSQLSRISNSVHFSFRSKRML